MGRRVYLPCLFARSLAIEGRPTRTAPQHVRQGRTGPGKQIAVDARLDTPVEVEYYRNSGILQTVLRNFLRD